jgi:hypothetical protein
MTAAPTEAIKILILAISMIAGSWNARLEIKIDIVNPIPPKILTAKIWNQFVPIGLAAKPPFMARKLKIKIPRGFPSIRPAIIPIDT